MDRHADDRAHPPDPEDARDRPDAARADRTAGGDRRDRAVPRLRRQLLLHGTVAVAERWAGDDLMSRATVGLRRVGATDLDRVAGTLGTAFQDDPVMRWWIGDDA